LKEASVLWGKCPTQEGCARNWKQLETVQTNNTVASASRYYGTRGSHRRGRGRGTGREGFRPSGFRGGTGGEGGQRRGWTGAATAVEESELMVVKTKPWVAVEQKLP